VLHIGRKEGESVIIADRVKVTLLSVSGKTAKLGFEFPSDMPVHREEVYQRIQEENKVALQEVTLRETLGNPRQSENALITTKKKDSKGDKKC